MRESGYDLNQLLFLQQVALIEADAAASDVGRRMHLRIARAYEDEISRRTAGRMRFRWRTLALATGDTPVVQEPRILVSA